MEETNKEMAQKIDALTALLKTIPPMVQECTAARRARAAAAARGGDSDGDGGGDGDQPGTGTGTGTGGGGNAPNNSTNRSDSNNTVVPTGSSGSKGGRIAGVLFAIFAVICIGVMCLLNLKEICGDMRGCCGGDDAARRAGNSPSSISSPVDAGVRGARLNTAAVSNASYESNLKAQDFADMHSTA